MSVSLDTNIVFTQSASSNHELLQEISSLAEGINCESLMGIGTLNEYETLMQKALEVKSHFEGLELPPIEGIDDATEKINEVIEEIKNFDFDFRFAATVDDSNILNQLERFLSAMSSLNKLISNFSPNVSISGVVSLPDSLKDIQALTKKAIPLIECSKRAIDHFKNSVHMSPSTEEALQNLENLIKQTDLLFNDEQGETPQNSEGGFPLWALLLSIILPTVAILSIVIGVSIWWWKNKKVNLNQKANKKDK